jgi:hypothetical protein
MPSYKEFKHLMLFVVIYRKVSKSHGRDAGWNAAERSVHNKEKLLQGKAFNVIPAAETKPVQKGARAGLHIGCRRLSMAAPYAKAAFSENDAAFTRR